MATLEGSHSDKNKYNFFLFFLNWPFRYNNYNNYALNNDYNDYDLNNWSPGFNGSFQSFDRKKITYIKNIKKKFINLTWLRDSNPRFLFSEESV